MKNVNDVNKSVSIYRPVINHEEIFEHYQSQPHLKKIVTPKSLHVSLAWDEGPEDWSKFEPILDVNYSTLKSDDARTHILYSPDNTRTFTLQLKSPSFIAKQAKYESLGATFFHIDSYTPHISLDYSLPTSMTQEQIDEIEPFAGRIYLDGEILEETNSDWRSTIKYKQIKRPKETTT